MFHEHAIGFANALKLCRSTRVIGIFIGMSAQSDLMIRNEGQFFIAKAQSIDLLVCCFHNFQRRVLIQRKNEIHSYGEEKKTHLLKPKDGKCLDDL